MLVYYSLYKHFLRFILRFSFYLFFCTCITDSGLKLKTFRSESFTLDWTTRGGKINYPQWALFEKTEITSCLMRQVYPVKGPSHHLACVQIPALHNSANIADNPPCRGRPPRCQCASESDQRACYKFIHAPWSLCYCTNYITAKCLVNQRGGKRCPQLIRVPGFISLHISQYHITVEERCNC